MADELDHYRQLLMDDRRETHALASEARAALAQPERQWPTDEEIDKVLFQAFTEYMEQESPFGGPTNQRQLDRAKARAVLARWGRPASEPVPQQEAE
jgi:hypothetical protein